MKQQVDASLYRNRAGERDAKHAEKDKADFDNCAVQAHPSQPSVVSRENAEHYRSGN